MTEGSKKDSLDPRIEAQRNVIDEMRQERALDELIENQQTGERALNPTKMEAGDETVETPIPVDITERYVAETPVVDITETYVQELGNVKAQKIKQAHKELEQKYKDEEEIPTTELAEDEFVKEDGVWKLVEQVDPNSDKKIKYKLKDGERKMDDWRKNIEHDILKEDRKKAWMTCWDRLEPEEKEEILGDTDKNIKYKNFGELNLAQVQHFAETYFKERVDASEMDEATFCRLLVEGVHVDNIQDEDLEEKGGWLSKTIQTTKNIWNRVRNKTDRYTVKYDVITKDADGVDIIEKTETKGFKSNKEYADWVDQQEKEVNAKIIAEVNARLTEKAKVALESGVAKKKREEGIRQEAVEVSREEEAIKPEIQEAFDITKKADFRLYVKQRLEEIGKKEAKEDQANAYETLIEEIKVNDDVEKYRQAEIDYIQKYKEQRDRAEKYINLRTEGGILDKVAVLAGLSKEVHLSDAELEKVEISIEKMAISISCPQELVRKIAAQEGTIPDPSKPICLALHKKNMDFILVASDYSYKRPDGVVVGKKEITQHEIQHVENKLRGVTSEGATEKELDENAEDWKRLAVVKAKDEILGMVFNRGVKRLKKEWRQIFLDPEKKNYFYFKGRRTFGEFKDQYEACLGQAVDALDDLMTKKKFTPEKAAEELVDVPLSKWSEHVSSVSMDERTVVTAKTPERKIEEVIDFADLRAEWIKDGDERALEDVVYLNQLERLMGIVKDEQDPKKLLEKIRKIKNGINLTYKGRNRVRQTLLRLCGQQLVEIVKPVFEQKLANVKATYKENYAKIQQQRDSLSWFGKQLGNDVKLYNEQLRLNEEYDATYDPIEKVIKMIDNLVPSDTVEDVEVVQGVPKVVSVPKSKKVKLQEELSIAEKEAKSGGGLVSTFFPNPDKNLKQQEAVNKASKLRREIAQEEENEEESLEKAIEDRKAQLTQVDSEEEILQLQKEIEEMERVKIQAYLGRGGKMSERQKRLTEQKKKERVLAKQKEREEQEKRAQEEKEEKEKRDLELKKEQEEKAKRQKSKPDFEKIDNEIKAKELQEAEDKKTLDSAIDYVQSLPDLNAVLKSPMFAKYFYLGKEGTPEGRDTLEELMGVIDDLEYNTPKDRDKLREFIETIIKGNNFSSNEILKKKFSELARAKVEQQYESDLNVEIELKLKTIQESLRDDLEYVQNLSGLSVEERTGVTKKLNELQQRLSVVDEPIIGEFSDDEIAKIKEIEEERKQLMVSTHQEKPDKVDPKKVESLGAQTLKQLFGFKPSVDSIMAALESNPGAFLDTPEELQEFEELFKQASGDWYPQNWTKLSNEEENKARAVMERIIKGEN